MPLISKWGKPGSSTLKMIDYSTKCILSSPFLWLYHWLGLVWLDCVVNWFSAANQESKEKLEIHGIETLDSSIIERPWGKGTNHIWRSITHTFTVRMSVIGDGPGYEFATAETISQCCGVHFPRSTNQIDQQSPNDSQYWGSRKCKIYTRKTLGQTSKELEGVDWATANDFG